MLSQLKALTVVLTLATLIFIVARPVCLRFTAPEDFARRRLVWYVLTIAGFVCPSFWLYVFVAVPLMGWAAKRDSNPAALFLLLVFVIPQMQLEIPIVGIRRLFDLNNWRLLGLVILLPAVVARLQAANREHAIRLSTMDVMLLLYGALQVLLLLPHESLTNTMRRAFLFLLDTYIVFFAFSRLLDQRRSLADAMGALCLSGAIMAPMAAFESLRSWLLYTDIARLWGDANTFAWLFRGDSLRAQTSTGHAITLGFVLAMSIGCWMYLKSLQTSKSINLAVLGLLIVGLFFTYSRGPLLTAVLASVVFLVVGSQNAAKLISGALLLVAIGAVFVATPFGAGLVDGLPFIGNQDQDTVAYRQQLAVTSWALIQQNPFFGNPFVLLQMEDLRQGEGVIDLVNAYLQVALFYGLTGAALYIGVHATALTRAYVSLRRSRASGDADMRRLGAALIGCGVANLFFMATGGHSWHEWILAGLLASYASLQPEPSQASPDPSFDHGHLRPRRTAAI